MKQFLQQSNTTDLRNTHRLPARLNVDQIAILLGFNNHDVPLLVSLKLLQPLGKPAPNSQKWFAAVDIEELRSNRKWLDAATKAIGEYWRHKHLRREARQATAAANPQ